MPALHFNGPTVHGSGRTSLLTCWMDISQAPNGDVDFFITSAEDPSDFQTYKESNGTFRSYNGLSERMHGALVQMIILIEKDVILYGKNGPNPASIPLQTLAPCAMVECYVDNRYGKFGVEIRPNGDVVFRHTPGSANEDHDLMQVVLPADTSFQNVYQFVPTLVEAICIDISDRPRHALAT